MSSQENSMKKKLPKGFCFDFGNGECLRGDACKFSHSLPPEEYVSRSEQKLDAHVASSLPSSAAPPVTTKKSTEPAAVIAAKHIKKEAMRQKNGTCFDFAQGYCRRGDACIFVHTVNVNRHGTVDSAASVDAEPQHQPQAKLMQLCREFSVSCTCKYGDSCKFSHVFAARALNSALVSMKPTQTSTPFGANTTTKNIAAPKVKAEGEVTAAAAANAVAVASDSIQKKKDEILDTKKDNNNKAKKVKYCFGFAMGTCNRGNACIFLHEVPHVEEVLSPPPTFTAATATTSATAAAVVAVNVSESSKKKKKKKKIKKVKMETETVTETVMEVAADINGDMHAAVDAEVTPELLTDSPVGNTVKKKRKKNKVGKCFAFAKTGSCQLGDECKFRHVVPTAAAGTGADGSSSNHTNNSSSSSMEEVVFEVVTAEDIEDAQQQQQVITTTTTNAVESAAIGAHEGNNEVEPEAEAEAEAEAVIYPAPTHELSDKKEEEESAGAEEKTHPAPTAKIHSFFSVKGNSSAADATTDVRGNVKRQQLSTTASTAAVIETGGVNVRSLVSKIEGTLAEINSSNSDARQSRSASRAASMEVLTMEEVEAVVAETEVEVEVETQEMKEDVTPQKVRAAEEKQFVQDSSRAAHKARAVSSIQAHADANDNADADADAVMNNATTTETVTETDTDIVAESNVVAGDESTLEVATEIALTAVSTAAATASTVKEEKEPTAVAGTGEKIEVDEITEITDATDAADTAPVIVSAPAVVVLSAEEEARLKLEAKRARIVAAVELAKKIQQEEAAATAAKTASSGGVGDSEILPKRERKSRK